MWPLCPYDLWTARKCTYFDLAHRFDVELSAETPRLTQRQRSWIRHLSAFSRAIQVNLWAFVVPVGKMDSRSPFWDLVRYVGWNYGALNGWAAFVSVPFGFVLVRVSLIVIKSREIKTPTIITQSTLESALERSVWHFFQWKPVNRRIFREASRKNKLDVKRQNDLRAKLAHLTAIRQSK
jgi:hypothetical protein